MTAFDWNQFNTQIIGATTLDSICTIWDIDVQQPVSKVHCHPSEVYDISFSNSSMDVFSTCGKDGSIRLFDMRCMNKYSVLHENSDHSPILRLSWNPINSQTIAYLTENKNTVSLIDIRSPEQELLLKSHSGPVNAVDWSPSKENVLISAGEDKQVGKMI